jgi:meiotically up-regulated gene 157 (Mug157) protein
MDDANIPSLLSIPYIGFKPSFDKNGAIEKATREWVLSRENPFFYHSPQWEGIGNVVSAPL